MPEYQVDVTGPNGAKTSLTVTTPGNGSKPASSVAAAAIAANHLTNTTVINHVQANNTQATTQVKQQVAAANEVTGQINQQVAAVNEATATVVSTPATTLKPQRPKSASKSKSKSALTQNSAGKPEAATKALELNELNDTIDALLTSYTLNPKDSTLIAVKRMKNAVSQIKNQDDVILINTKLRHIISKHNEVPNKIAYDSLLLKLTKTGNNTEFPNLLDELQAVSLSNQLGGRKQRKQHTLRNQRKQRKQSKQRTQRKQRK